MSSLPPAGVIASTWRARQFPALRTLDLSANRDSGVSAYRFLTVTELRAALHEVRLPRARGDADRDDVERVARELPELRMAILDEPGKTALIALPVARVVRG